MPPPLLTRPKPDPRPCCHRHPLAQLDSDDGAGFMRGHCGTPSPDLSTLAKGLPSLQPTAHIGYLLPVCEKPW